MSPIWPASKAALERFLLFCFSRDSERALPDLPLRMAESPNDSSNSSISGLISITSCSNFKADSSFSRSMRLSARGKYVRSHVFTIENKNCLSICRSMSSF